MNEALTGRAPVPRRGSKQASTRSHEDCPSWLPNKRRENTMVVIGVDPHKGSHTAVAIDEVE